MKFSIIIPVYNSEMYLTDCINSVLRQTFREFELLLVDDGSNDQSLSICEEFRKKDLRVKVLRQIHSGVSAARNLGLRHAGSEYVLFMDSDDTVEKDLLVVCKQLLESNQPDMIIFSMLHHHENQGNGAKIQEYIVEDKFYPNIYGFLLDYARKGSLLVYSASNKVYRKSLLDQFSLRFPVEVDFGEDRIFNYDYLQKCKSVATVSAPLYHYYLRPNASLSQKFRRDSMDTVLLLHKAKKHLFDFYQIPGESCSGYLLNDLYGEIVAALLQIVRHWSQYPGREKIGLIQRATAAAFPGYFQWTSPAFSGKQKLLSFLIAYQQNILLYVLLWLKYKKDYWISVKRALQP